MSKQLALKIILFITIPLLHVPTEAEQSLNSKLARNVSHFDSENSTTSGQLIDFAQRFHIPMGIELVQVKPNPSVKPVHARHTTVRSVLEQIVKQRQGMVFSVSDGVVHVFDQSISSDSKNFLNLHIPQFRAENESLFGAEYWLRANIRQVVNPVPKGRAGGQGHGIPRSDGFDNRSINLSVNDATVRQLLDGIASQQGNALWIVRILPSELMTNGRFFAQVGSVGNTAPATDFRWEFIPLKADISAQ